jgi:small-conductance mechanosensitive channel
MMRRINPTDLVAQSIDDIEKIQESVDTTGVTGWDIAAALIILAAAWPIGGIVARIVRRGVRRVPGIPSYFPDVVGKSVRFLILFIAIAIGLNLVGVDVGWFTIIITLVGIVVFLTAQPLVENFAAGLLLQTRPAFNVGDEIETHDTRGEVLEINARSTVIQTRDWKGVHIPNKDVLSDTLIVFSAYGRRRSAIELEIDYSADIAESSQLLVEAASAVEGVYSDPPPYIRARGFGTSTYILSLRWWHDSDMSSGARTLDGVVREVKRVLDEAGIGLPSPELIVRQPDQTQT